MKRVFLVPASHRLLFSSLLVLFLGLVVGPIYSPVAADPVKLTRISFAEQSSRPGYVVRFHVTDSVTAQDKARVSPREVVVTLHGVGIADNFTKDQPVGPVQEYVVERTERQVQIRFQLANGDSVRADTYFDRRSPDLLMALNMGVGPAGPAQTASHQQPQPYAVSQEEKARWKLDCVVIDAGHGGKDTGATAYGILEKDVVLDVALQLGQYVENRLGIDVIYTRKTDTFVPLHERGRIANEKCGKLFISIHANAVRSKGPHSPKGAEVYFLGLHKEEEAARVMERENSVIRFEEDPDRYKDLDRESLVVQSLAQNMYLQESEKFAEYVASQFKNRAQRPTRGVKQAGFLVLWRASMPAILVELGFLTNPREAQYLKSERGQVYLASAIFRALREYRRHYEKGLDVVMGE